MCACAYVDDLCTFMPVVRLGGLAPARPIIMDRETHSCPYIQGNTTKPAFYQLSSCSVVTDEHHLVVYMHFGTTSGKGILLAVQCISILLNVSKHEM